MSNEIRLRVMPAITHVRPGGLDIGMEIWRHPNPHVLWAMFRAAERRGEVALVIPESGKRNKYGQYVVTVKRLKRERRRWPWVAAGGSFVFGSVGTVTWMLWESRYVLLSLAAIALSALTIGWVVTRGGRKRHCPGC